MDKEKIGTNAGIVWRTLYEGARRMSLDELTSSTNLSLAEVAAAIGWLAREDKIWTYSREDDAMTYSVLQEYYF